MERLLPYNVIVKSPESMSSSSPSPTAAAEVVEKDFVGLGGGEPEEDEEEENELEDEGEEEELELGLTLGKKVAVTPWAASAQQRCRILTAKDLPSLLSRASPRSCSASSVSSSSGTNSGGGGGGSRTKRATANSVFPEHQAVGGSPHPPSQGVVGWPPVRAFRMNSLFNHSKENLSDTSDTPALEKVSHDGIHKEGNNNDQVKAGNGSKGLECKGRTTGRSHFVKVNMDGDPIGRKVDLSAHHSYETLAITLELMFQKPIMALCASDHGTRTSKLLDGSSEFALTYKDRDGDWMLVGDVPWGMFLGTVRRLRIMRTTEANGIACRFQSHYGMNGLPRACLHELSRMT